jgi:hypothetical protein
MAFTRSDLENKIKEIYDLDTIPYLINNQITKYIREYQWSYRDIARALYYFFVELGNDPKKSQGIGIVPYVMDDSRKYFADLERQQELARQEASEMKDNPVIVIKCTKPETGRKRKKLIHIEDITGGES